MINYSDFEKVDIRVGTVIEAKLNKKSSNPSLYLLLDFGERLVKKQLQHSLPNTIFQRN